MTDGQTFVKLLCWKLLVTQLCPTLWDPWTVARQAPPSMGFSRQDYWNGLPFPSPGDLPDPGTEPRSPALQADSLPSGLPGEPLCWKVHAHLKHCQRLSDCILSLSRGDVHTCLGAEADFSEAPTSIYFGETEDM